MDEPKGRLRSVDPPPITGRESTTDLIRQAMAAGIGRQFRDFVASLQLSIDEDHTLVWSLAGIVSVAGYTRSCLIPLMRRGLIHAISTTDAVAYHDLQGWWPRFMPEAAEVKPGVPEFFEVDSRGDDRAYAADGIVRVYDIGFDEGQGLLGTDRALMQFVERNRALRTNLTTAEFFWRLGQAMKEVELANGHDPADSPSLLVQAHVHQVPIFCGAFWDGSIGLNLARFNLFNPPGQQVVIEGDRDVHQFASLMHQTIAVEGRGMTLVIMGGGVPKNYSLQIGPYLTQICGLSDELRYTAELQICDAPVDNMSLSSAPAVEALTWGKVLERTLPRNVYVRADWSVLLPVLTQSLLEQGRQLPGRQLFFTREGARQALDRAIRERAEVSAPA
ncbi:MAG: deoxyhypusine synthase family protein [Candidatus Kerfeldbacteria bacterium]|nr:deoxyhypusine synthase family protein [Candidatus Kerfeldbacteria bacterium]